MFTKQVIFEVFKFSIFTHRKALNALSKNADHQLFDVLVDIPTDIQDIFLELIYSYCTHNGTLVTLLDLAISKEVEISGIHTRPIFTNTYQDHSGTLFREDTPCVKLLMRFCNENKNFLCLHLPAMIKDLTITNPRSSKRQSLNLSGDLMLSAVSTFIENFVYSAENCPRLVLSSFFSERTSDLLCLLLSMDQHILNKFGNVVDAPTSLDFIMFKFICPLIVNPKKMDIEIDDSALPTLVTVSKLLNDITRNNTDRQIVVDYIHKSHKELRVFSDRIRNTKLHKTECTIDEKCREISQKQLEIFLDTVLGPSVEVTVHQSEIAQINNPSVGQLGSFHKTLILATWDILREKKNLLGTIFYRRLFEVAPSVVPLFRYSSVMNEKLVKILDYVLDMVREENFSEIKKSLWMLGKRHSAYGAVEAHFVVVKQVFFWTLAQPEMLGNSFGGIIEQSWEFAFNIIVSNMLRGMKEGNSGIEYKEEKKCTIQ